MKLQEIGMTPATRAPARSATAIPTTLHRTRVFERTYWRCLAVCSSASWRCSAAGAVMEAKASQLFVSQCHDGIEARRPLRPPDAEEQAYPRTEHERQQNGERGNERVPLRQLGEPGTAASAAH